MLRIKPVFFDLNRTKIPIFPALNSLKLFVLDSNKNVRCFCGSMDNMVTNSMYVQFRHGYVLKIYQYSINYTLALDKPIMLPCTLFANYRFLNSHFDCFCFGVSGTDSVPVGRPQLFLIHVKFVEESCI